MRAVPRLLAIARARPFAREAARSLSALPGSVSDALAKILEQMQARDEALRAEMAAATARSEAQMQARDEALRAEMAAATARGEALRAEMAATRADAAARDSALRTDAAARDSALRTDLRGEIAALRESKALSVSYANVGDEALAALTSLGRISVAAPDDGAPVATPSDLARLRECAKEPELVAAIAPLLRAARGFNSAAGPADPVARVLVNSEGTGWLDAPQAPLPADQLKRPDLFATWAPFWAGRVDAARGAVGRLAHRALQLDGCARELYEAKLGVGELTSKHFGQLVDYHSRVPGPVRGVLFNARAFWLYESRSHMPLNLIKSEWGARGSRALLREFFDAAPEPPLVPLLRHLCRELGVAPRLVAAAGAERAAKGATSAFLGAGGSARVFCVAKEGAAAPFALKASVTLSRADLEYEYTALERAAAAGAPVVPVVPGSLVFFVDDAGAHGGGGFLLRDVCASAQLDSLPRYVAAFAALRALHATGFAHGDARRPNLVERGRGADAELLWIDLRAAAPGALAVAQRADARTLAASALGLPQGSALPARVDAELAGVPGAAASYASLAAAVWAVLGAA